MSVNIRIAPDVRDKINSVCEVRNETQSIVVGYLVDLNEQYDFFDPEWRERIAQDEFKDIFDKQFEEERRALDKQTHRAMLKLKTDLLKEYVRALGREERRAFLESVLGDLESANFLDEVVNYQLFIVDGKRRACQPDSEGKPVIKGIDSSLIAPCEKGFHILGQFCDCDLWRDCPLRLKEYQEWLVEHGSESDRRKFLDDQSRRERDRRRGRR
jgi:hypothetical protein